MSALRKSEETTVFTYECAFSGCCEKASVEVELEPQARRAMRRAGWEFTKHKTVDDGSVELWRCPVHAEEIRQRVAKTKARSLLRYSSEQPTDNQTIDERAIANQKRRNAAQSSFERYFGPILTGNQMSACMRLRHALDVVEISGNANMSYDGVGIDSVSFGAKSIQETVLEAQDFKRRCELHVVAQVHMYHHDAWKIFHQAVFEDFSPPAAGDFINRSRNDRLGERKRRDLAVDIIDMSSAAIAALPYKISNHA